MEQQQIELAGAASGQLLLRSHSEIISILGRTAQGRICKARIAFGSFPLSLVKIMTNSSHEAVALACDAAQRTAKHLIGLAIAVDIGSHKGANAFSVSALDDRDAAIFLQGFAKMHVASAAPGAVSYACQVHQNKRKLAGSE